MRPWWRPDICERTRGSPSHDGEGWLISDVYLDGAISEVATRRSEFGGIIRTQGVDGLIAALNRKADVLTGTMAKAF